MDLKEVLRLHGLWLRDEEGGKRADLRGADLRGANLREADLRGANLDYAAWPLWCGSFDAKADRRLAAQLAYHFCRIDFGDDAVCLVAQDALVTLANEFHRVGENGIPPIKERGSAKQGAVSDA